jgi:membrane protease YdiL (CAAX protease family)
MVKSLKAHPVITFYILAFVLAWCIKVPVSLSNTNNILFRLLPSFFPAIAALITAAIIAGKHGVGDLLKQAGKLRVSPVWYLIALVGPMALNLLALVLAVPFGEPFPGIAFAGIRLLPVFLIATFSGLGEELGWRGFALPRLQDRFNPVVASLIVGLLWWAWHLPDALTGPARGLSLQQDISLELRDLVQDLAISILMAWIYNGTNRSVLLATLFHVGIGLLQEFLAIPNTPHVSVMDILLSVALWIAAVTVVLASRRAPLAYRQSETPETAALLANNSSDTAIG